MCTTESLLCLQFVESKAFHMKYYHLGKAISLPFVIKKVFSCRNNAFILLLNLVSVFLNNLARLLVARKSARKGRNEFDEYTSGSFRH